METLKCLSLHLMFKSIKVLVPINCIRTVAIVVAQPAQLGECIESIMCGF